MTTVRLTVGQAVVRFLAAQRSERDGTRHRLIEGCFGIFGHGNVAGLGQGLLEAELEAELTPGACKYLQGRNEQAMVHAAAAFARTRNRMSTLACTSSIGPGATNMVTGAALATINRLPVLLLPGDVFATRVADPVLQQLEQPNAQDISVNDAFRPVSRFFDRVWRPEQLPSALLAGDAGADRPGRDRGGDPGPAAGRAGGGVRLARRAVPRAGLAHSPDAAGPGVRDARGRGDPVGAATAHRGRRRGHLLRGHARAEVVRRCASASRSARPRPARAPCASMTPLCAGAIGTTGTTAANELAARADVVIGIGTRWSDFTTASRSLFAEPGVRFVNINVASFDAAKQSGVAVVADARAALDALALALAGWTTEPAHRARAAELSARWQAATEAAFTVRHQPRPAQAEVIGVVNEVSAGTDIVLSAAGSMPGDLHKLWRTRDTGGYHVEYGYSCMGYEIAGGLGAKLAAPDREVFVMVGDGSYLMMASELVTAVQEGVKLVVVCVDNHGFASIGNLSESVGSQRFGTSYRYRGPGGRLDGGFLPVDLAANAASLGVYVLRARTIEEFRQALVKARAADRHDAGVHRDRPGGGRPVQRRVVGRAGGRGGHAGQYPGRPGQLREGQGAAAALPVRGPRTTARSA